MLLLKITILWYSNIFTVHSQQTTILRHHPSQPGESVSWKRHLQKDSIASPERALSGTAYQPPCSQTPGTRLLDPRDPPKASTTSDWTCTPSDDVKVKIPGNETDNIRRDRFPKLSRPGLQTFSHRRCLYLFCGKKMPFICTSQSLAKKGKPSETGTAALGSCDPFRRVTRCGIHKPFLYLNY